MREVLADAGLADEDLGERRADVGGAGVVLEVGLDARGELARSLHNWPARRERPRAVVAKRFDGGHQRRVVDELARLHRHRKALAIQRRAQLFPRRRRGGGRWVGKAHLDRRAHLDLEAVVRLVEPIDVDAVAEVIDVLHRQRRHRVGLDADGAHGLAGKGARAQVGDMLRGVDRAGVGVGGAVREMVLHAGLLTPPTIRRPARPAHARNKRV
jgi:hypothetical protein